MGGQSRAEQLPQIPPDLPEVPPPAPGTPVAILKGIDVSHHNGTVDWAAKRTAGNVFCSIKATEGTGNVDPQFARNWSESEAHGFLNCAYHFYHPALDARAQAKHFISVMGSNLKGHLPPLFDFEIFDGLSGKVTSENARICVSEIEQTLAVSPLLYGSPGFLEQLGDLSWAAHLRLWIAHYGVSRPHVPAPWTQYTFWQTSDANGWDLDVFRGSLADLNQLRI